MENFPRQLPILAVLTGITQWVTTRMAAQPSQDPQQQTMNQVMQFMPLMFIFFSLNVPAGLVLYWVTSNLYQMIQQYFIGGWGMLRPVPALATIGGGPRATATGSRGASAPTSVKSVKADAPDALAEQSSRADKTPSTDGRRRRNKRR